MPNVDDHMDELFQTAAENYPLKIRPGNFDELMPVVAGETVTNTAAVTTKRKYKMLLLLVLTAGGITGIYLIPGNGTNKTIDHTTLAQPILKVIQEKKAPAPITTNAAVAAKTTEEADIIFRKTKLVATGRSKSTIKILPGSTVAEETVAVKTDPVQPYNNEIVNPVNTEIVNTPQKQKELEKEVTKPAVRNENKKKTRPSFYYGVSAGTELNQVKNQGMTKPGFTGSILAGLQINAKFSVETGIGISQKKYYSQGKYFKPDKGEMPTNMLVNSLTGTSTLIEIPVTAKYNFSKKKNTFYGKAGLSTYVITKETNKYQAVVNGQEQEINSTYKNAACYPATEIFISTGYQHTVSKKINIRVEPYIQIPLKGIGIGSLPVTSTGLQLVLTRNH